ncbi:MAG: response regulator [Desulfosalsimonadaceae bacterium]
MSSSVFQPRASLYPGSGDSGSWRVLVVDDEADIRTILQFVLEDTGFLVEQAPDGETGLKLCAERPPHIVITDIRMPGMDGISVLERIKSRQPEIEVIVITAFSDMDVAIRALQLDASDFITKPVNESALHVALNRAMERFASKKEIREYTALLEQQNARTLKELIESHAFRDKLIEYSMDGILGCNAAFEIAICNQSLRQMLGMSPQARTKGLRLADFFSARDYEDFLRALAGGGHGGPDRLFLYEILLLAETGDSVPMQVSAARLLDEGENAGIVCFFRDLRKIRRLEQDLADQSRILHQDKMMSLGRLAASIVHEINNPLSGMLNYMHLMNRILERGALSGNDQERFRQYLALVESETSRCSKIVSSLLSFSRAPSPAFGAVDAAELFHRCLLLSQHKLELQNIACSISVADGLSAIKGDFNQIQQCVINLIFNAADAMPEGGRLQLSARRGEKENEVVIEVCDSGPGIAEKDLSNLFEPFFSTKPDGYGVGLGLSTVYGIVNNHGGRVTASNRAEGGACFTLVFPVCQDPFFRAG